MFGNNTGDSVQNNLSTLGQTLTNSGGAIAPLGGLFSRLGQSGSGNKGKGAPRQPAPITSTAQVPQAAGGFFQPMNGDARSQLLQAMMQRSRGGASSPIVPTGA